METTTLKIIGKAILESWENGFFSLENVVGYTGINVVAVERALDRLSREKLIRKIVKRSVLYKGKDRKGLPAPQISYRLADRAGLAARIAPRLQEDSAAERMWRVIRLKKLFTRKDLVILAGASKENAKWYTKQLRNSGIIRPTRKGGRGVEWTLVKDVGAKRQ